MSEKINISASIVLYNENLEELKKTINSFLSTPLSKKLFLIDNTNNARFKNTFSNNNNIVYISNNKNVGFGKGHNQIIKNITNLSDFHLILNPDVTFKKEVIPNLISELKKDDSIAMIAPKVLFPNKKTQDSCRKYPTPKELILRRFGIFKTFFKKTISKRKYHNTILEKAFYPEYLTGCFQLYKTADFVQINGFDERYFLYMEDVDICKKIDAINKKKMFFPSEKIQHTLKQGSSKNLYLFFIHLSSAIKYFKKWGIS